MEKDLRPKLTRVFHEINDALDDFRILVSYGGSSSSKTISAMQHLTYAGMLYPDQVITVIGESVPVLKRSVIQDWRSVIMGDAFEYSRYNSVDRIYRFHTGSIMQFVPGDDPGRFHGPRQDYALFDEAYNIKKDIFDQVEIRTRKNLFLTWNPVSPFWGKLLSDRDDCYTIHSTYQDNPHLEASIIKALERRASMDDNFYRVYVLGEYGSIEGLIYAENKNWKQVSDWPKDEEGKEYYKWRIFGLDFGFTHDPSAFVEIRYADGQLWVKQHIYETELTNDVIAERIHRLGFARELTIADSAEAKSIREILNLKVRVQGAEKGPDSVKHGINLMKQYRVNVLRDSVDLIKEYRNYSWAKDRHGEWIGKPLDGYDHLMDAIRYGVTYKVKWPASGKYSIS